MHIQSKLLLPPVSCCKSRTANNDAIPEGLKVLLSVIKKTTHLGDYKQRENKGMVYSSLDLIESFPTNTVTPLNSS